MKKIKQYRYIILIGIIILGLAFYWYEWKPTQIKKECSWFTNIIPADIGVTKEQAEVNKAKLLKECPTSNSSLISVKCWAMKDTVERPPQLEKEEIREATKSEYDTCLRQNGL